MENTQTAVEWLMDQITFEEDDENNPEGEGRFASFQDYVNLKEYFDKAKEMEKDQIMRAYMSGEIGEMYELKNTLTAKQYYENNYGK